MRSIKNDNIIKLLLVDNYDSFTYNLVQYFSELGAQVIVIRSDEITTDTARNLKPDGIIISPGPCSPNEAGKSLEIIQHLGSDIPILGVCLGHQCIGQAFGAKVIQAPVPVHGKTSAISHNSTGLFKDLPHPLKVTRYHSLIVDNLPVELEVTAHVDGLIMALKHRDHPIYGVQFHPESIETEEGKPLLNNFLNIIRTYKNQINLV